jgi:hypothetical protein
MNPKLLKDIHEIMKNKKYILAFGEQESSHLYTLSLTRSRLLVIFFVLSIILLSITYFMALGFHRVKTEYRMLGLKKENLILKRSYTALEGRTQQMEASLKELQIRNRQICLAAAMPMPEFEYGVGGPEFMTTVSHIEIPEIKKSLINLEELETGIDSLHRSMRELEETISTKIIQIAHFPSIRPVRGGWISSSFGNRIDPFTGNTEDHPGIDISIKPGAEVCATAAGIVKAVNHRVTTNKGYGKYILLDHGYGHETLYAHLSKIFVKRGQKVKRWDIIGLTGNTGKSTAPHIHYGVLANRKPRNPMDFILE